MYACVRAKDSLNVCQPSARDARAPRPTDHLTLPVCGGGGGARR